jgi:hypothetical protein
MSPTERREGGAVVAEAPVVHKSLLSLFVNAQRIPGPQSHAAFRYTLPE